MAESNEGSSQVGAGSAASTKADKVSSNLDKFEELGNLLQEKLSLSAGTPRKAATTETPEPVLKNLTLDGVAEYIKSGKCRNIITMAGAGLSTSAGIPDFRSPGTGLYNNLQKYNLPSPQAIFTLDYFKENPEPFFKLSKELMPGTFKPTPGHYFLRMLDEKGLLLRHFTQNIDTLEHVSGLAVDRIIEAHGTFYTSHCIECREEYTMEWIKGKILEDVVPTCTKDDCIGVVKPDIVFFGENLPYKFFKAVEMDIPQCDLLIILGTSLTVQPFASLPSRLELTVPRLCINLEKPSGGGDWLAMLTGNATCLDFDGENNTRDVFWQGTCDDGCMTLADELGWGPQLRTMIKDGHSKIDAEKKGDKKDDAKKATDKKKTVSPQKGMGGKTKPKV